MLKIAQELGFSETAFVQATNEAGIYTIRFFSPKKEIPLCGHATLASSKVIFNNTGLEEIRFINIENVSLFIKKQGDEILMEFPLHDTEPVTVPDATLNALGLTVAINTVYAPKNNIILIEIDDASTLANLTPDFDALIKSISGINGVLVTARSNTAEYDFHYRYFWPWAGTNEDPVTGGVQTFLTKYWADRLGKNKMQAFQSSARTGTMRVELHGDKVLIAGRTVIILEGEMDDFTR